MVDIIKSCGYPNALLWIFFLIPLNIDIIQNLTIHIYITLFYIQMTVWDGYDD